MLIMRYSVTLANIGPPQKIDSKTVKDFLSHTIAGLGLGAVDFGIHNEKDFHTWRRLELVEDCKTGLEATDCLGGFSHVLTDHGICSAFNAPGIDHIYKESDYIALFKETFRPSLQNIPILTKVSGSIQGLELILDIHKQEIFGTESGHIVLAIVQHISFERYNFTVGFDAFGKWLLFVQIYFLFS